VRDFRSNGSANLQADTVLDNRYQVGRFLAEGEYTRVYEGLHLCLGVRLVIKQLRTLYPDPVQAREQKEQYRDYARLLARLSHPSLVTVYDTFEHQGLPLIIMERVPGRDLEEIGRLAPKPLSEKRVMLWGNQLLDSLEYLHQQSPPVIVRGLQPSNIILAPEGRLRLIDFGLAKSMDEQGTRNIVKGLGEDGFAPLEQGAYSKTDERSDIYSLGATLYYLLTKEVPPSAAQRTIAPRDPLTDPREKNATVRGETWRALSRMMSLRPLERPASIAEVRSLFLNEATVRHCVECKLPLQVQVLEGVEIDRCSSCGGVWLDHGELELLREKIEVQESRSEAILQTIPLNPEHPAMKTLAQEHATSKSFWESLMGIFSSR